jgi:hypothetical protein
MSSNCFDANRLIQFDAAFLEVDVAIIGAFLILWGLT